MAACSLCKQVSLLPVDLGVYDGCDVVAAAVMGTVVPMMTRMVVDAVVVTVTVLAAWLSVYLRVCAVSHGPVQRTTAR